MRTFRNSLPVLALLALTIVLSGCGVVSKQPLPATALDQAERAHFEGAWVGESGDGTVSVRFTCDGVGHLGGVDWKDGRFKIFQAELVPARSKRGGEQGRYLSVREAKDKGWSDYYLVKYQFRSDDLLVIWAADPKPFAEAIKSGRLQGKVYEYGSNLITSPPDMIFDFIDDPHNTSLFDYQRPLIFRKVARSESNESRDACGKK